MQSQNIYGWSLIGTSARNKYGNYGAEIYDEKNPLKAFFGTSEEKSTDDYEDPELITIGLSMSFYPNVVSILYILDVLCGQQIKLAQVASTSQLLKNRRITFLFFEVFFPFISAGTQKYIHEIGHNWFTF